MIIDPHAIEFTDHPTEAHMIAPRAWEAHGKRRAIRRGDRLTLDFAAVPQPGDLVMIDGEDRLAVYTIGVTRKCVAAVVTLDCECSDSGVQLVWRDGAVVGTELW